MIFTDFIINSGDKNKAKFNKKIYNLSNLADSQNLVSSIFSHSIEGMEKEEKIVVLEKYDSAIDN